MDLKEFHSFYATGVASLSLTKKVDGAVENVFLHLSTAPVSGEYVTITLDAAQGATYDTLLASQGMAGRTDYHWQPTRPLKMGKSDQIKVAMAQTSGANTYGVRIDTWAVAE